MLSFIKFRWLLFSFILPVFLWQCAGTGKSEGPQLSPNITSRNLSIDSTLNPDPKMEKLIDPYQKKLNDSMNVVIGHTKVDLTKDKPEAPLNNFVADLMLKRANRDYHKKVEMSITNVGGFRTEIMKGPITLRQVFEVMPFENELVVLEMSGSQLITLGKQIGDVYGEAIAGMHLEFRDDRLVEILIGGEQVINDSTYHVVTTDFLSSPNRDRLAMLGNVPKDILGVKLRDAIIDEVKARDKMGQPINAKVEGRIVFHNSENN